MRHTRRLTRRRRRDRRRRPSPPARGGITIGDLRGPTAVVDAKGRVGGLDGSWRLEWGGGCDDRWHVAHDEVAVRQRRIDDAPVLETAMRVPGGDLIQRVASVSDGHGRAVVIELANESASAVAAALVVRAPGPVSAGPGGLAAAGITLRADRPPGGVTASPTDPWPRVLAGPGAEPASVEAGPDGGAALVVPVPHLQTVSFTITLDGEPPARAAGPMEVAAGWRAVAAAAATIHVPDPGLDEAWRRLVPDLVIAAGSADPRLAAQAAWFLDVAGLHDEADRARAELVVAAEGGGLRDEDAVAALLALASRDLRRGEPSGLDQLAGPLAEMAGEALTSSVLDIVAAALDHRSPDAGRDARRLAAERCRGWWEPVAPVIVGAGSVIGAVVDEDPPAAISLLPTVPPGWRGGEVDVRGIHTVMGEVSFSVRWHGRRPALLWERTGGPDGVTIAVPGLDSDWETTDRSGEALLAAPEPGPGGGVGR